MIAIDMEMPLDCQGCRFCAYTESRHRCGNVCTATKDWNPLDGEFDKPNWCPLEITNEIIHCKDCKHYKRVYNDGGCEMINYSGCEKGHHGYPNWSCADAERAVSQCKPPYKWSKREEERYGIQSNTK